jgi:hypothetical protein
MCIWQIAWYVLQTDFSFIYPFYCSDSSYSSFSLFISWIFATHICTHTQSIIINLTSTRVVYVNTFLHYIFDGQHYFILFQFDFILIQTKNVIVEKTRFTVFFHFFSFSLIILYVYVFIELAKFFFQCETKTHSFKTNNNHYNWFSIKAMITLAVSGNDVNENENIELTHYLSYMIVYCILQLACIITVCIRKKKTIIRKKTYKVVSLSISCFCMYILTGVVGIW